MEDQIFQVAEPVVVDLEDVKEQKVLVPACSNVKVRINKASFQETKDKDIRSLKLELRIVDGIPVNNPDTGETESRYINKPLFTGIMDLVYWADTSVKDRASKTWWETKQHLVELKKFAAALDLNLKALTIDDEFFPTLLGRELLVDIQHEAETAIDQTTGERVKLGTFKEKLRNWKKVS